MKGSGLTIQVPVVDLMEVGAGGGSIARVSRLGTLQVGTRKRGRQSRPRCYDLGGTEPTVTDADFLLGYLDAKYFPRRKYEVGTRKRRGRVSKRASPNRWEFPTCRRSGAFTI